MIGSICQIFREKKFGHSKKKQLLLDSILRGWHLPKFYFRKIDDNNFECVDGQQRLTAIWEFYSNTLPLNPKTAREFGGQYYKDLPTKVADDLDDFELDIEEIEDATDAELEELFLRLQLGTPLNTAERLNAVGGELRDFVKQVVSKHEFFAKRVAVKDTRFAHFDIAVKWVFVEARGIQPQMRFPQLESLLKDNRSFSESSDLAKRVKATLKYLAQAFPEKCTGLRNRANILSVCMLASAVVRERLDKGTASTFGKFVNEFLDDLSKEVEKGSDGSRRDLLEYQQAINFGSTGGDSLRTRMRILTTLLASYAPSFSGLLRQGSLSGDSVDDEVRKEARAIRDMVMQVNERHSSDHGKDLFKMTNDAVKAFDVFAVPCRSEEQYGKMIDALYKLIYEGSGDGKRLPPPLADTDFPIHVKHLRNILRHDVDHGDDRDVAKKRIRAAKILELYSGKKTVAECGPEDFLVFHLRSFRALRAYLEKVLGHLATSKVASAREE